MRSKCIIGSALSGENTCRTIRESSWEARRKNSFSSRNLLPPIYLLVVPIFSVVGRELGREIKARSFREMAPKLPVKMSCQGIQRRSRKLPRAIEKIKEEERKSVATGRPLVSPIHAPNTGSTTPPYVTIFWKQGEQPTGPRRSESSDDPAPDNSKSEASSTGLSRRFRSRLSAPTNYPFTGFQVASAPTERAPTFLSTDPLNRLISAFRGHCRPRLLRPRRCHAKIGRDGVWQLNSNDTRLGRC